MAVTRIILPRKGFVQSQHGLTQYEGDQDANWALLDANVAFMSDVAGAVSGVAGDLGWNGVASGFVLSTSSSLAPGITAGVLYANGIRYAASVAPTLPAAPASLTSYLFYNSATGFYYQSSLAPATAGDALIGVVVAGASAITSVTTATTLFGQISLAPSAAGAFIVAHILGRVPTCATVRMTSGGAIWFQSPTDMDGVNLYLVASAPGVTGKAVIW
jgi:hypothetical protein